jgi:hypothetical protein
LFNLQEYSVVTRKLIKNIVTLWKKSGNNFTFLYLKESSRLIIRFLADQAELTVPAIGIRVKRDSLGLPRIIPSELRSQIALKNQLHIRFVLTILGIYKVMPTRVKVKVDTITSPFVGKIKSFDAVNALKDLNLNIRFGHRPIKYVKLETASPNAIKALWGSASDVLAFWSDPYKVLILLKMYMYHPRGLVYAFHFLILFIISLPFFLLSKLLSEQF